MQWTSKTFGELSLGELYTIIRARELVFVQEQKILYVDCDLHDSSANHLMGHNFDGELCAYMRIFAPGLKFPEASFGRVLTSKSKRGVGLGKELVRRGIEKIHSLFGNEVSIRIAAQSHLVQFYSNFGFRPEGLPFLEVNVPHHVMVRNGKNS